MTEASGARRGTPESLLRDVALVVLLGVALGLAYNWLGKRSSPSWGLSWVAQDRLAMLEATASIDAVPSTPSSESGSVPAPPVSDDPLAVPGAANAASTIPDIPAIGRPVQIATAAVAQLAAADAALIVDAREPDEYAEGHIPGAINLPYDEAVTDPDRLSALDAGGRPIVAYCGGGTCELSLSLAWELIGAGHERVAVYMGGFPEWRDSGHPVATGEAAR